MKIATSRQIKKKNKQKAYKSVETGFREKHTRRRVLSMVDTQSKRMNGTESITPQPIFPAQPDDKETPRASNALILDEHGQVNNQQAIMHNAIVGFFNTILLKGDEFGLAFAWVGAVPNEEGGLMWGILSNARARSNVDLLCQIADGAAKKFQESAKSMRKAFVLVDSDGSPIKTDDPLKMSEDDATLLKKQKEIEEFQEIANAKQGEISTETMIQMSEVLKEFSFTTDHLGLPGVLIGEIPKQDGNVVFGYSPNAGAIVTTDRVAIIAELLGEVRQKVMWGA